MTLGHWLTQVYQAARKEHARLAQEFVNATKAERERLDKEKEMAKLIAKTQKAKVSSQQHQFTHLVGIQTASRLSILPPPLGWVRPHLGSQKCCGGDWSLDAISGSDNEIAHLACSWGR
jgi:hypothetical protein